LLFLFIIEDLEPKYFPNKDLESDISKSEGCDFKREKAIEFIHFEAVRYCHDTFTHAR
jgi:hypothetical protein